MGQKFRIRCVAKPRPPPGFEGVVPNLNSPELNEVFSTPIESRSKRPSSGRQRSRSPAPRKRPRGSTGAAESGDMDRILTELQNTQEKLATTQSALSKMVLVLQQCVTRLGAVEAATETKIRSSSGEMKEIVEPAKPPPLKRQRSKTMIFRTEDNQNVFFNVMDDGMNGEDSKLESSVQIPPLLRQFSQEFQSTTGDYPMLEPGDGILPPRIASGDLNSFLNHVPERSNTPSLLSHIMSTPPVPSGSNLPSS
eukprot:CAMPEP_0184483582 /NCGR_PEP_ID=MMETSP0113_2-20130426/5265_1 /TAXON_ID=91329 /ORGANISM="Norrisiella sphaerica, Strain BC52" /LENGTH=251 /DNA_ID=CAMNT_0026864097 /DNA_START=297 /DNA_END=1049 /DNA_ORIENTATION=+